MANVTVSFGPANSVTRNIDSTEALKADRALYAFLGASAENTEVHVNGTAYHGELFDGDEVSLVTKANSKAS
jgi:hypothetical protein